MQTIAKITPDDYPDLLSAIDERITQRELARRYDCAPSLIARHVAKAKRAQEFSEVRQDPDVDANADTLTGSLREILQARIRDPSTSPRDLASLVNVLGRLEDEEQDVSGPPLSYLRRGTLILEPGPSSGSEPRFRLMLRERRGIQHVSAVDYDLTAADATWLILCALAPMLGKTPEALGLTPEDIAAAAKSPQR